jgi:2-haloacid dehalogenase
VTTKAIVFDAYGTLYDVQSVATVTEEAFPGHGELITQIWRMKQLEYSWLRSLMERYVDFWTVTRESLAYTLDCLGLSYDERVFDRILQKYHSLDLYPDAKAALGKLNGYKLAILSNGSQEMLDAVVQNSGFNSVLCATISIDSKKIFKPSPAAYTLIESTLEVAPPEVLFVSCNAFDACGAKSFGLRVAWIERVSAIALQEEVRKASKIGPLTMFKAMRMRMEHLGYAPDYRIGSLSELPGLVG